MRTVTLALALLLASTGLVLLAPPADAWAQCNATDDFDCPGAGCVGRGNRVETEADCNVVFVPYP